MSKQQKRLARLCAKPPPSDFKWSELRTVLEHFGYTMLTNSGSRRKFYHPQKQALIICHEPHPTPDVDKGCVVEVVEHLRAYGFLE